MQVRDIIQKKGRDVISIGPEASVAEAIARMAGNNIGTLPVTDSESHLMGILSERDVLRLAHENDPNFRESRVADVMTRDPICCDLDLDVEHVMGKMSDHRVGKLPVLCGDRLCGIISVGDVIRVLYEKVCSENEHLISYIHGGR